MHPWCHSLVGIFLETPPFEWIPSNLLCLCWWWNFMLNSGGIFSHPNNNYNHLLWWNKLEIAHSSSFIQQQMTTFSAKTTQKLIGAKGQIDKETFYMFIFFFKHSTHLLITSQKNFLLFMWFFFANSFCKTFIAQRVNQSKFIVFFMRITCSPESLVFESLDREAKRGVVYKNSKKKTNNNLWGAKKGMSKLLLSNFSNLLPPLLSIFDSCNFIMTCLWVLKLAQNKTHLPRKSLLGSSVGFEFPGMVRPNFV